MKKQKQGERVRYAPLVGLGLALLFWGELGRAQSLPLPATSELVWADPEKNAILLEPPPSEARSGDRVCLLSARGTLVSCDIKLQRIAGKDLLFVPPALSQQLVLGQKFIVKKILLSAPGEDNYLSPSLLGQKIREQVAQAEAQSQVQGELPALKTPGGEEPEPLTEQLEFKAEDFPDIYLPKPKRSSSSTNQPTDKTKQTKDTIRKIFQEKSSGPVSFVDQDRPQSDPTLDAETAEPAPLSYVAPAAIRYDIFSSLLSQRALVPAIDIASLRFRTLEPSESSRSTLWKANKTSLKTQNGYGFELGIMRNESRFVSLGWRRFAFASITSQTLYDSVDDRFTTLSQTEALQQATSAEAGWLWPILSPITAQLGLGLDIFDTQIRFRSDITGFDSGNPQLLAYGQSRFLHASTRTRLGLLARYKSFGVSLAMQFGLPLGILQKDFEGGVYVPDRISFEGSSRRDLDRSLSHRLHTYTAEAILGVQYVPHR